MTEIIEDIWKRYDNTETNFFSFSGKWNHTISTPNGYYRQTRSVTDSNGAYVTFTFTGTSFRLLSTLSEASNTNELEISIDGTIAEIIDLTKGNGGNIIVYEKKGLKKQTHTIKIRNLTNKYFVLDAVDISDVSDISDKGVLYLFKKGEIAYTITNGTLSNLGVITPGNASNLFANGLSEIKKEDCLLIAKELNVAKIIKM